MDPKDFKEVVAKYIVYDRSSGKYNNDKMLILCDEFGVGCACFLRCRADADGPQTAHRALLLLTVSELERPGVQQGFLRLAELRAARPLETLCMFQQSLATATGNDSSFDACHG